MSLLLMYVIPGFAINVMASGLKTSMVYTYGVYYTVIALLFLLLRRGHIHLTTNVLVLAGIAKAAEFYFAPVAYQFYVHSVLALLICGAIYVRKYQLYICYAVFNLAIMVRPLLVLRQITRGTVHPGALVQSIHVVFIAIFITITVHYLTRILNKEISEAEKLEEIANTDELTGIGNRRKFERRSEKSINHPEGKVVLLLDIDRFKTVNDEFGHERGDQVLKAFAVTLQSCLRDTDACYRWGGEEFVAVLEGIGLEEGRITAERTRECFATADYGISRNITVSIGMTAELPNDNLNFMMKRADEALYRAKDAGRNRVEIA